MNAYVPTGCCGVCGYRFRLRKDKTLQAHRIFPGVQCAGTGKPDRNAEHNRLARDAAANVARVTADAIRTAQAAAAREAS